METKGLILVHTGDGKGKTTAGLGLALGQRPQGADFAVYQGRLEIRRAGSH